MRVKLLVLFIIVCSILHAESSQNSTQQNSTSPQNPPWLQKIFEDALSNWINSHLLASANEGLKFLNSLILWTPDVPDALFSVHIEIIKMLAPLYLLVLSWNAIEIMTSDVIATQAKARITIQNSVISMLLVASSLPIYKGLLAVSQQLSQYLLSIHFDSTLANTVTALTLAGGSGSFMAGCSVVIIILSMMLILFMLFRIFVISAGVLFFPIGIFAYFFSPLKKFGKLMISIILFYMFVQVILALIVFVMNVLIAAPPQLSGIGEGEEMILRALLYIGGLTILLVVPLMILLQIILIVAAPEIKLAGFITSLAKASAVVGSVGNVAEGQTTLNHFM